MNGFLQKFCHDPIGFFGRAMYKVFLAPLKYKKKGGYDAGRYWHDRFKKHGLSFKSVGDEGLNDEQNQAMYEQAAKIILALCAQEKIDLSQVRVLEIGCGNGFYTQLLWNSGVRHYVGMDITDIFFPTLKQRHPGYEFVQQDITKGSIHSTFDLILMIDVIEHIVGDPELDHALANVAGALADTGLFLLAPVSDKGKRSLFYVRFWTTSEINKRLPGYAYRPSIPFRYSQLLALRKPAKLSQGIVTCTNS